MNIVSLLKRLRIFEVICVLSTYLIVTSIAHASMTCSWFDEFSRVSDPLVQEKLEAHVKALAALENYEIVQLEKHYFIVEAAGRFCKEVPRLRAPSFGVARWRGQECPCL